MSAAMTRAWLGNVTMAHSLLLETEKEKILKTPSFFRFKEWTK
jgi:hypothetical protein